MKIDLAESMGLQGEWVVLREVWEGDKYVCYESLDGETWQPFSDQHDVLSSRWVGGPRDGEVLF